MFEKITVTGEQIIGELQAIASEFPDYVYETPAEMIDEHGAGSCFYVHPSPAGPTPGCIAGLVLSRLGVPLDVLSTYEFHWATAVAERVLDVTGPLSGSAVVALQVAQSSQDGEDGYKSNWADAVAEGLSRTGVTL